MCDWLTDVQRCTMLSGHAKYCHWHEEWLRLLSANETLPDQRKNPPLVEADCLAEWLQLFALGGEYGANPGQWHSDAETTLGALHGRWTLPPRTEREKFARNLAHWKLREKTIGIGVHYRGPQPWRGKYSGQLPD